MAGMWRAAPGFTTWAHGSTWAHKQGPFSMSRTRVAPQFCFPSKKSSDWTPVPPVCRKHNICRHGNIRNAVTHPNGGHQQRQVRSGAIQLLGLMYFVCFFLFFPSMLPESPPDSSSEACSPAQVPGTVPHLLRDLHSNVTVCFVRSRGTLDVIDYD